MNKERKEICKKLAKDLKIGDVCYVVDADSTVSFKKVSNIKSTENGDIYIEYENGIKGFAFPKGQYSTYGMYASKVFFSKETAMECLEKRIEHIFKQMDRITKYGE